MSSETDSKLMKTVTDASVIVGLSAGVGYLAKKAMRESFLSDPSASVINYAKWVAVMAGSIYLKDYLEKQKILPTSL